MFTRVFHLAKRAISHRRSIGAAAAATATIGGSCLLHLKSSDGDSNHVPSWNQNTALCDSGAADASSSPTKVYTADEVARHNGKTHPETWVSYQGKVYNVTQFAKEHPGGDLIQDAAGGPLENYWAYWTYHVACKKPMPILQKYEIGVLKQDDDDVEEENIMTTIQEMYESDPDRNQCIEDGQVELIRRPWNAETQTHLLAMPFTNNKAFYVRNHCPVPILDDESDKSYQVMLECDSGILGSDKTMTKAMSLATLKQQFKFVTINSILQCAGNRGADMVAVAPTAFVGTPYEHVGVGMIGHASWRGVRLADVLLHAYPGLKKLSKQYINSLHVEFEGVDGYIVSTPLERVLDKTYDALLATEMNGEPLPPDHGGPVRVLLPGIAGARNCKWVHAIRIMPHESKSCFQKTYYLDYYGQAIQEMPMQCFLIGKRLSIDDKTKTKRVKVNGVAWGGGSGVGIRGVQVTADGGKTWTNATLVAPPKNSPPCANHRDWSWVHFQAEIPLPNQDDGKDGNGQQLIPTVTSRAFDRSGLQQPEKLWYPKGYLSHGWHSL